MTTIKEWYQRVEAAWPQDVPELTFEEGVRAVRKLYRFATGNAYPNAIVETTGNRFNAQVWAKRAHEFRLNVAGSKTAHGIAAGVPRGWQDLVHDMSHWLVQRGYDYPVKAHSREHARFELKLVNEVVKRGWLNGALKETPKPTKAPVDPRLVKLQRTEAALKRWEAKMKRAQTALKKLERRQRAYQRAAQSAA